MKTSAKAGLAVLTLAVGLGTLFAFQNCAKAKYYDPDTVHSAIVNGLCQVCNDPGGLGLSCRQNTANEFGECAFESCRPGFRLDNHRCIPVICTPGAIANCEIPHGEGRMTCNATGIGYGPCTATTCASGYTLQADACVDLPPPFCTAGSQRDCGTESTDGSETCNSEGSAYDACVFGDCKAGYYKNDQQTCAAYTCEPSTITPCTAGAGVGFQTCNSQGSGWGTCVLNGCQPGYTLKEGVCVVQVCTPGETMVCEFDHGSGSKTCSTDGLNFSACSLVACQAGYAAEDGKCVEQQCTPGSPIQCQGEGGSGTKYCYQNGHGYGECQLSTCDQGFRVKNGKCVGENTCDPGETATCTVQNGSGTRTCNSNSNQFGPCVPETCNSGYELVNQGGSTACKKSK